MCGIAGTVGVEDAGVARAMSGAMAHRGPDDSGLSFDGEALVALAHRRLSVIDVTSGGHQPMSYEGGRYDMVFNGEVYNFRELRKELEGRGHRFASQSDTEVVLAAWSEWGEAAVSRFRGMFAFAIWDRETRELFLARDRFGIKPLYYTFQSKAFVFASELGGILASGLVSRAADPEGLWWYLSLGSIPQPGTALRGVRALPPGHTMRLRTDLSHEFVRYWDLAEAGERWRGEIDRLDPAGAAQRLRGLLDEATRLHMISDVPVGAFLSGGIDSTAVVGLMAEASGAAVHTFAVGFAGDDSVPDEREWARLAASRFGCRHTEVIVRGEEVAEQFDEIVDATDQPSLDGTNTFLVSKAAGRSIKVVLSGLGGDELFAGYPHFGRFARARRFDGRLGPLRGLVGMVPGRLLADRDFLALREEDRYGSLRTLVDGADKAGMLCPDLAGRVRQPAMSALYEPLSRPHLDSAAQTTYVETRTYLASTLLRDVDAMSMAASLEVRPVLLDHVVAEFAFALPQKWKLNGATNKPLLVDAVRDLLPQELQSRPKLGFELPLRAWLSGPLRDRAVESLQSPAASSVFSREYLQRTVKGLREGRRAGLDAWANVVLVEWLRRQRIDV